MKIISRLYIALLVFPLASFAEQPNSDTLIQQLSSCDAKFFHAMKEYDSSLKNFGQIAYNDDIAYWKVPNRKSDEKSVMMFATPMVGTVELLGYFDDITDLESLGIYYYWGFLAKGSPESIAAQIQPLIKDGARLRKDGEVFVRSEIFYTGNPNGKWIKNENLTDGTVPKESTVERVFLLEDAGDKYSSVTKITCSLQGTVSAQLLATERPDIQQ